MLYQQHGVDLLEMSHLVGAIDEVGRLPEEGVDTGGDDNGLDLTLLAG